MPVSAVANSNTFQLTTPSDTAIRMTRLFDAPRALVFEAMTEPEHVKRWWGRLSDEHSLPVCEVDLRPGGAYRYVSHMPQGEITFYGVYREVRAPERVVFTEIFDQYPDVESVVTVVLTEENGKTRFTITADYPSMEVRDAVLQSGMEHGAALSYDHLEEVAAELARSASVR